MSVTAPGPDDLWMDLTDLQAAWPGHPKDEAVLRRLMRAAQNQLKRYGPAMDDPDGPDLETRQQALVLQVRELHGAVSRKGADLVEGWEYAVRVQPLSATVRALMRPPTPLGGGVG